MAIKITAKFPNESAEAMLRRLRKRLDDSGWRGDLRRHEYYTSRGQQRHNRMLSKNRPK